MFRTTIIFSLLATAIGLPVLLSEWESNGSHSSVDTMRTNSTPEMTVDSSATVNTWSPAQPGLQRGDPLGDAHASGPQSALSQRPWAKYGAPGYPFGAPSGWHVFGNPFVGAAQMGSYAMVFRPVQRFDEIFRFDVYPNWVKARWPRVSNTPSVVNLAGATGPGKGQAPDWELEGMRVPLVTGTSPADLSGSLTYYFDRRHQVQRINFQGWTGDASRLVNWLINEHGFEPELTRLAGLYVKRRGGRVHSLLRLEHHPMIRQSEANRQLFVFLELNHPQGNLPLSWQAQTQINP